MQKDWGYAALIEYGGKRILFDTGNNPDILARNANAKGIDFSKLDFVVMSHRHGDHMGGMTYLFTSQSQSTHLCAKRRLWRLWFGFGWDLLVDKNTDIAPDIHLLTLVSDKPGTLELRELSLALNTDGLVIIVGCSHAGIDKIVELASAINPRNSPHCRRLSSGCCARSGYREDCHRAARSFQSRICRPGPLHRRASVRRTKENLR